MVSLSIANVLPAIRNQDLEFRKYANLLGVLISRRERWNVVPGKPLDITVDLTTFCNLRCPYCVTGRGELERPTGILRVEGNENILNFCGFELFMCSYFSNGEPLLNKHLPELMTMASEKEVFTVISTNLSVPVGTKRLEALVDSGLNVVVASIDGTCETTYKKYRVGGDFNLVLDNLRTLVEIKKQRNREFPIIEWRFLVFEHNQHEMPEVLRKAEEIGVDLVEFFPGNAPPDPPPGSVRRNTLEKVPFATYGSYLVKSKARTDTLLRRRLLGQQESEGKLDFPSIQQKCDWLYFGGMYYPEGNVGPCCVVGNTETDFGSFSKEGGYEQIWNGDIYQSARQLFKTRDISSPSTVCHSCPMPSAQDQMFKNSLRAYLLNAPEWFLAIVSADPDRFFHPHDPLLLPREVIGIVMMSKEKISVSSEVTSRLFHLFKEHPGVLGIIRDIVEKHGWGD
ncbi:hypothetical protein DO97_04285 [Neosynechococcus sphagnicola sy1]|uniref:Radical SAM core domain-containing protein n=1 Tax=Neosynechococcus sphagnicola sy1 TaxID=1497020 RepID=A0A098TKQ8_9CYAN|nr:radical SAM/SPASM domain-containing protein [Neosynechococcus sphagnicola]KGF72920.1 hypothetical protein DO97_04285 [Neosynechococcus sphagnicola sy1]